MATETLPFDVLDYLRSDEDLAGYLREMLEADDLSVTALAVETIERAKSLPADPALDLAARLYRAAHAVGLRLTTAPRAA
jgi:DNA-binding phage protein